MKENDQFTLYELSKTYQNVLMLIEDGADPEEFEGVLDTIKEPLEEKAESYKIVMDRIQADIDMCRKEEKRLAEKRQRMEKNILRMKDRLFEAMKKMDIRKLKSKHYHFTVRKNPPSVKIDDLDLIPEIYSVVTVTPDKKRIKEALLSGEDIKGASLIQNESLQIR